MARTLPVVLLGAGLIAVILFGVPRGGLIQKATVATAEPQDVIADIHTELDELRAENQALREELAGLADLGPRVEDVERGMQSAAERSVTPLHAYPWPESVSFCNTTLPLDDVSVRHRFENEWNRFLVNRHWVLSWMRRARTAFPVVEAKLAEAGMPDDLKYVMAIESAVEARAYSSAGAVGYWQFIRATGKRYGLRRTSLVDERRELGLATDAAIKYLTELYDEFQAWPLALAAYNAGERRVRTEVEAQGTSDYFNMILPKETEAYVFKAAVVKIFFENPDRYGFVLTDDGWEAEACDVVQIKVSRKLDFKDLAATAGISYRRLKELNPHYRTSQLTKGTYAVTLPRESIGPVTQRFSSAKVIARDTFLAEAAPVEPPTTPDPATAPPR